VWDMVVVVGCSGRVVECGIQWQSVVLW
jgi:hypothetical protein